MRQKTEPFFMADKSKGRRVNRGIFSTIYVWKHHLIYFLTSVKKWTRLFEKIPK